MTGRQHEGAAPEIKKLAYMWNTNVGVSLTSDFVVVDLSLMLSITPKGEYDFSLMGKDAAWSFIPKKTEEMCSAIRLIFVKEKFRTEYGRRH